MAEALVKTVMALAFAAALCAVALLSIDSAGGRFGVDSDLGSFIGVTRALR